MALDTAASGSTAAAASQPESSLAALLYRKCSRVLEENFQLSSSVPKQLASAFRNSHGAQGPWGLCARR